MRRRNSGFSLLEMMMVVALTMIGSSVAVIQIKSSINSINTNAAASVVIEQLKYARELAVDQRHSIRVEFVSPATIQISRLESDGSTTIVSTSTLPAGYSFG